MRNNDLMSRFLVNDANRRDKRFLQADVGDLDRGMRFIPDKMAVRFFFADYKMTVRLFFTGGARELGVWYDGVKFTSRYKMRLPRFIIRLFFGGRSWVFFGEKGRGV